MSADREFDHLENMSDMNGSGHYSPGQYASTREQDAEADRLHQALQAHYSQLFVTTVAQIEERR